MLLQEFLTFLTQKKQNSKRLHENQLKDLDNYKGNIDMISNKVSNVRTWSYVANKKNWVENLIIGYR